MANHICTTNTGKAVSAYDKPAYLLHQQLRIHVLRDLGPKYANYLATPAFEGHDGIIDWFSESDGELRPFSELSQQDKAHYIGDVENIRQELQTLASQYEAAENDPAKNDLGKALNAASQKPAQKYRYLLDKQAVVVYWGFSQVADDYKGYLKQYFEIAEAKNTSIPPTTPPEPPISTAEVIGDADVNDKPSELQTSSHETTQRFDLLIYAGRMLWGSIGLSLLIALTLLLLWFTQIWPFESTLPPVIAGSDNASLLDEIKHLSDEGDQLATQLQSLRSDLMKAQCDCDDKQAQAKPIKPEVNSQINEVVKACDVESLSGSWQSKSDQMVDIKTKEPLIASYTFSHSGRGTVTIDIPSKGLSCKGTAKAYFNEKCELFIQGSKSLCPKGSYYREQTVNCKLNEKQEASCVIQQDDIEPINTEFIWRGL